MGWSRVKLRVFRASDGEAGAAGRWIEAAFERWDLVPDLAEEIGSARWFRGFGTMLGLGALALSFWPSFSEVEAAVATPIDGGVRDGFRSRMIMPLAMGGESGSRMGPTGAVVPLANAPERPRIAMVATLGQGDSFGRMLQRAGIGAGEAARIADMVAAAVPLGDIDAGTRFDITLGSRPAAGQARPLDTLAFRARLDLDLSIVRQGGTLALVRHPIAVDSTPLRITGTVGTSLYRSTRASGAPLRAVQQYLQTLDSHVDLESDIAPGDAFDMVVAYRRSADGESEVGDLLYAGLSRGGKPRAELLRWGKQGQFFEASGIGRQTVTTAGGGMVAPVAGRVTSSYGMRRHPILGYTRMHAGMDFGAPWGSPIHAASSGIVSFAGRHGGHGNYVRLEHGGGIGTGYAHMSRIAVSPGARVQAGQVIGYVGSSGLSTGPHLHYELYRNGQTVNPAGFTFSGIVVRSEVDKQELAAFKARLAQLKAIPSGKALQKLTPKQAVPKRSAREIGEQAQSKPD